MSHKIEITINNKLSVKDKDEMYASVFELVKYRLIHLRSSGQIKEDPFFEFKIPRTIAKLKHEGTYSV